MDIISHVISTIENHSWIIVDEQYELNKIEKDLKKEDIGEKKITNITNIMLNKMYGEDKSDKEQILRCLSLLVDKITNIELLSLILDTIYDKFSIKISRESSREYMKIVIGNTEEIRKKVEIIKRWTPKLLNEIDKDNINDSLYIINLIFKHFKDLACQFYPDVAIISRYLCTGFKLGEGNFAKVYLGYDIVTLRKVAVKKQPKNNKTLQYMLREIEIMKSLNHPNIIRLYHVEEYEKMYYFIMEYCIGESLSAHIKRVGPLSDKCSGKMLFQIAKGLKYLRDRNILHRDIKPGNILLHYENDELILKLCDFTFACYLSDDDMTRTMCGTPLYMAPEILQNQPYTPKSDLWSVGIILYEMLTGKVPYNATNMYFLKDEFSKPINFPMNISQELSDLLRNLLQVDPKMRITWEEFYLQPMFCANNETCSNIVRYREKEQTLQETISNLKKENLSLGMENVQYRNKIIDLETQITDFKKQINDLKEQITNFEKYKSTSQTKILELTTQKNRETNKLWEMYSNEKNKCMRLLQVSDEYQIQNKQYKEQLQYMETEYINYLKEHKDAREETNNLRLLLMKKTGECEMLQHQVELQKNELAAFEIMYREESIDISKL